MPDEEARRQIFEVTVRKHKLASRDRRTTRPFAPPHRGYTGSDIELALTTAWSLRPARAARPAVTDAHLTAALDDFILRSRDQAAIDHMTVLALDECAQPAAACPETRRRSGARSKPGARRGRPERRSA